MPLLFAYIVYCSLHKDVSLTLIRKNIARKVSPRSKREVWADNLTIQLSRTWTMLFWCFVQEYTCWIQLTMFYCVISMLNSLWEIKSLKVKMVNDHQCRNGRLQGTPSIGKILRLIMFSERLRHCQAATKIYIADELWLSTWFLTNLGLLAVETK